MSGIKGPCIRQTKRFDRNFIAVNTVGFDEMIAEVERTEWADLYKHSGLSPEHLEKLAKLF